MSVENINHGLGLAPLNTTAPKWSALAGKRVLVVEDEALVSMLIEQILEDFGCVVVGPAMRVGEGLRLVASETLDMALLDINVAGEQVFPIAEALDRAGTPFAFSTGYGEIGLPESWRGRPTLRKPYSGDDVVAALMGMLETPAE